MNFQTLFSPIAGYYYLLFYTLLNQIKIRELKNKDLFTHTVSISKFNIVPKVMGRLMDRMGSVSCILSIKRSGTTSTTINFDRDGHSGGTCKCQQVSFLIMLLMQSYNPHRREKQYPLYLPFRCGRRCVLLCW